jgi:hypothetical protein
MLSGVQINPQTLRMSHVLQTVSSIYLYSRTIIFVCEIMETHSM